MSIPTSPSMQFDSSDSSNSLIVEVVDDATDFDPQPATGVLLELGRAEKEKLDRYRQERENRLRIDNAPQQRVTPPQ